jgi:hypothetical protein
MTKTVDVAAGQKVASPWGNEIRDRTLQVFATVAERNAQWLTPPDGATCITLDTYTVWRRRAGAWVYANPGGLLGAVWTTSGDLGTPGGPGFYDGLVVNLGPATVAARVTINAAVWFGNASGYLNATADVIRLYDGAIQAATKLMQVAVATTWLPIPLNYSYAVAAGQEAGFKIRYNCAQAGGTSGSFRVDAHYQINAT